MAQLQRLCLLFYDDMRGEWRSSRESGIVTQNDKAGREICVRWRWTLWNVHLMHIPFPLGMCAPSEYMVPWVHPTQLPNDISIGSAVFAGSRTRPADRQTDRPTDRQTTLLRQLSVANAAMSDDVERFEAYTWRCGGVDICYVFNDVVSATRADNRLREDYY